MTPDRRRTRALAWVFAAMLMVFAGLLLRSVSTMEPSPDTDSGSALAAATADGTPPERASSHADTPMPPLASPLPQLVTALATRAREGDPYAACRIAVETLNCEIAWTVFRARPSRDVATGDGRSASLQDERDRFDLAVAEQVARCGPISDAQRAEAGRLLADAAHRGNVTAALLYADGLHFHSAMENNAHAFLAHPGFDRWRAEAPAMLERLHRQGVWEASMLLQIAYSSQYSVLAGLVPDDPERALAHRLLQSRLRGSPEPPLPKVPPDRAQAARELAEGWHRNYYGGRVGLPSPGRGPLGLAMFTTPTSPDPCAP